jgi:hypothetical protein
VLRCKNKLNVSDCLNLDFGRVWNQADSSDGARLRRERDIPLNAGDQLAAIVQNFDLQRASGFDQWRQKQF